MHRPTVQPSHYPAPGWIAPSRILPRFVALLLAILLGACASVPGEVEKAHAPASEPLPWRGERPGRPAALDLRADDVLMHAASLIGTRYRFGGNHPDQGFDCSGFTSWVFSEAAGIALPRTAREQYREAGRPIDRESLQTGDLVFFLQSGRSVDHVGIYVGEGRFVHAPSRGGRVRIDPLSNPHWQRSFRGARRIFDASR